MAGCRTQEQYARRHLRQMTDKREAFPALDIRLPWDSRTKPVPFIAGGKWVVLCECGDAPMASPEWDEARCFNCGAIFRGLAWPAQRAEIEAELLDRPQAVVRAWLPDESVEDLRQQNRDRGIERKKGGTVNGVDNDRPGLNG